MSSFVKYPKLVTFACERALLTMLDESQTCMKMYRTEAYNRQLSHTGWLIKYDTP